MFNFYVLFWIAFAVMWFFIELSSPGLYFFLAFALGALCSAGAALICFSMAAQLGLFAVGSLAAFLLLRWFATAEKKTSYRTNVDALVGKKGHVVKSIVPGDAGRVKVNGEIWSARSEDDVLLSEGEAVEIVHVAGVHLLVRRDRQQ